MGDDSHQQRMKIKDLINNWLKNIMMINNFDLYDIVLNSSRLDDFSFTKWEYTIDKPTISALGLYSSPIKKDLPLPLPPKRKVVQQFNNLGSVG